MNQNLNKDDSMTELIMSKAFRDAAAAGALSAPVVLGVEGGYVIEATFGQVRMQLAARSAAGEQKRRVFTSIGAADSFLQTKACIRSYGVDATQYQAAEAPPRYARVAERLRQAHAALRPAQQPN
jgi:hypothetical protein